MEHLQHEHPLILIDLQPEYPNYEEEYDEDDDKDDVVTTNQDFRCLCARCNQEINWFHRYYYKCTYTCDYSIHKFCGELPTTIGHKSHKAHALFLSRKSSFRWRWRCDVCGSVHENDQEVAYWCHLCYFSIDLKCVVVTENKIYHPSHPHPLVSPTPKQILCECDACGEEHKGIFYHCGKEQKFNTCFGIFIHSECAFLPKKLLIQHTTHDVFSHVHPLTLSYSFSNEDQEVKYYPNCRICNGSFYNDNHWIYKCEKCWYYAHVDCATSRREPFMSIFSSGRGRTFKNYKDADHPDLLHLPMPDQTYSVLKYLFFKETGRQTFETDKGNITHFSHQHPLVLVHTQPKDITRPTSSTINSLFCHNPMKKIELLCNGCLRPVMDVPFYKCASEDRPCNFVLHEWCTRLPNEVQNHPGHPQHTLVLLPNVPFKFFSVFHCEVCGLACNGFVYSCVELQCEYYIDVHCGFIPEKITHEAHPNHLLSRVGAGQSFKRCGACSSRFKRNGFLFACRTCDFYLHLECALLLPKTITHKYDRHPMKLSYLPIENHNSEYFCENCEQDFDPKIWFYHCYECVQSMHSRCAPLILQSETAFKWYRYEKSIYDFLNVKFEGTHKIKDHKHPLSFVQGIESDGLCKKCCYYWLAGAMIFRCSQCKYAIHYECCEKLSN